MRNVLENFVHKIETHILGSETFVRLSLPLKDNVKNMDNSTRQYNMANARCILHNKSYRHTTRISNNYCFFTETMIARWRHIVTL